MNIYLGDGVYVSYDGYHVVLSTEQDKVFLDPHVLEAFLHYVEVLHEQHR